MSVGLLGRKIGMTQVYDESGVLQPVTVLQCGPCQVLQVRSEEADGYTAVQVGFEDKPRRKANKAERGHVTKVGAEPKRFVREFRTDGPPEQSPGDQVTLELFAEAASVDVTGTMKGRGTAGVMKRHGFRGLETTHGVQRKHRAAGSIGCSAYPSRVIKGRRMNGQYGAVKSTVRNLKVVRVDLDSNCLLVKGGVPGPNGGMVVIRKTNKLG